MVATGTGGGGAHREGKASPGGTPNSDSWALLSAPEPTFSPGHSRSAEIHTYPIGALNFAEERESFAASESRGAYIAISLLGWTSLGCHEWVVGLVVGSLVWMSSLVLFLDSSA